MTTHRPAATDEGLREAARRLLLALDAGADDLGPTEALRAALDAARAGEGLREAHPGEPHDFRMDCKRCGEKGFLHVAYITDGEVVRIEDRAALNPNTAALKGPER